MTRGAFMSDDASKCRAGAHARVSARELSKTSHSACRSSVHGCGDVGQRSHDIRRRAIRWTGTLSDVWLQGQARCRHECGSVTRCWHGDANGVVNGIVFLCRLFEIQSLSCAGMSIVWYFQMDRVQGLWRLTK